LLEATETPNRLRNNVPEVLGVAFSVHTFGPNCSATVEFCPALFVVLPSAWQTVATGHETACKLLDSELIGGATGVNLQTLPLKNELHDGIRPNQGSLSIAQNSLNAERLQRPKLQS
jgi:hypothetical protein